MKRKSKRIVAGLFLATSLLFSSCGGSGDENAPVSPFQPGIVIPEPEVPEELPEPEKSDMDEGVKEDTKELITQLLKVYESELTQEEMEAFIKDYAVEKKYSSEVMDAIIKFVTFIRSEGENASSIPMVLESFITCAKNIRIVDMFRAMKGILLELKEDAEPIPVYELANYSITTVRYADLEKLEKVANSKGDEQFTNIVSSYKNEFESLYIDEYTQDYYKNSYSSGIMFPDEMFDALELISVEDQLGIVRMWEQLDLTIGLDHIYDIFDSVVPSEEEESISLYNGYLTFAENVQKFAYFNPINDYSSDSESGAMALLSKLRVYDFRALVSILLKDQTNAATLLSIIKNFVLPLVEMEGVYDRTSEEARGAYEAFLEHLNALTPSHILVVGKLVDNLLAQFSEAEYSLLVNAISTSNIQYLMNLLLSKKNIVRNALSTLTVADKLLIADFSTLLGVDLYDALDKIATHLSSIVSLMDEASMMHLSSVMAIAQELGSEISENLGKAFTPKYSERGATIRFDYYQGELALKVGASEQEIHEYLMDAIDEVYLYQDDGMKVDYDFDYLPETVTVSFDIDVSKAGIVCLTVNITDESNNVYTAKAPFNVKKVYDSNILMDCIYGYETTLLNIYTIEEMSTASINFDNFVDSKVSSVEFDVSNSQSGWNIKVVEFQNSESETVKAFVPMYFVAKSEAESHVNVETEYHTAALVNGTFTNYECVNRFTYDFDLYTYVTYSFDEGSFGFMIPAPEYDTSVAGTYNIVHEGKNFVLHVFEEKDVKQSYYSAPHIELDLTSIEFDSDEGVQYVSASQSSTYVVPGYYYKIINTLGTTLTLNIVTNKRTVITLTDFQINGFDVSFWYGEIEYVGTLAY